MQDGCHGGRRNARSGGARWQARSVLRSGMARWSAGENDAPPAPRLDGRGRGTIASVDGFPTKRPDVAWFRAEARPCLPGAPSRDPHRDRADGLAGTGGRVGCATGHRSGRILLQLFRTRNQSRPQRIVRGARASGNSLSHRHGREADRVLVGGGRSGRSHRDRILGSGARGAIPRPEQLRARLGATARSDRAGRLLSALLRAGGEPGRPAGEEAGRGDLGREGRRDRGVRRRGRDSGADGLEVSPLRRARERTRGHALVP